MEKRTKDNPWQLKTPPLTSDYTMHVETAAGKEILVCTVGTTVWPMARGGCCGIHTCADRCSLKIASPHSHRVSGGSVVNSSVNHSNVCSLRGK